MGFFDLFKKKSLTPASNGGNGWLPIIHEPYTGAWQKGDELKHTDLTSFHAVFACVSLIASDVGKLRIHTKSMQDGVLLPTKSRTQSILKNPPLIRMDSMSQIMYLKEGTLSGIFSPNEARAILGYAPVVGGESPLMQQQNYSLSALAKRDNSDNPFGNAPTPSEPSKSAKAVRVVKPRLRMRATLDKGGKNNKGDKP